MTRILYSTWHVLVEKRVGYVLHCHSCELLAEVR